MMHWYLCNQNVLNVRIDYCSDSNYEGYYFTDNIIDGSDVDQGANFPISLYAQFYSQGNNLNPEDAESLCGNPVSFYCNNPVIPVIMLVIIHH